MNKGIESAKKKKQRQAEMLQPALHGLAPTPSISLSVAVMVRSLDKVRRSCHSRATLSLSRITSDEGSALDKSESAETKRLNSRRLSAGFLASRSASARA